MSTSQPPLIEDEWTFEDLKKLSRQIRTGLRALVQWMLRSVRKSWGWLLVAAGLIAGWQFYQYRAYTPYYSAKASFVYKELHKKTYGEMLDQLNQWLREGAYGSVANALQIPESRARQLRELNALNMYGSRLSEDITTEKSPFYVQAKTLEQGTFDSLGPKIAAYLNNNPYYVSTIRQRITMLQGEVRELEHELQLLDSFKYSYLRHPGTIAAMGSAGAGVNTFNPVALFDKSIEISRAIAEKNAAIDHARSVELLNDFAAPTHPVRIGMGAVLLRSLVLFVVAAIAILLFASIFRMHETAS